MTEAPASKPRLFHPTPGRFLLGLLVAVEGFLLLSEHFQWFPFNDHRGWTVLFALASVAVYLLLMLLGLIASLLVRWRFHFSIWSLVVLVVFVAILCSWLVVEAKTAKQQLEAAAAIVGLVLILAWFFASLLFRWPFQLGIWSVVVLMVTVAIPCSWLAVEMKRAREQREVVEEIAKLGGKVGYDYEHDSPPIAAEPIGPWLRKLFGDDFFINAAKAELDDDAQMERLKGLPKLQQLRLAGPQITDAGLQHLEGLTRLYTLALDGCQITDAGLEHLEGLTRLYKLDLRCPQITDDGLQHLEGLTQLQFLSLGYARVTDNGLQHLEGLTQLQYLRVTGTRITNQGVKKLWQALPNCRIRR